MEMTNEEVAILVAQSGPLNGQRWALNHSVILGRDPSSDIVIPDRQVSRHHARLLSTAKGTELEDLGSKNGTHCNGERIAGSTLLQDGDVVQIALVQQFVFLSSDATVPLEGGEADFYDFLQVKKDTQTREKKLRLEKRSRRVWIDDREVLPPLSVSQFRLLEALYENQGKVLSRQDVIAYVWGEEEAVAVSEQALDALVRRLRDRLAGIDPEHSYVVTIRGHGLRLDNPPKDE